MGVNVHSRGRSYGLTPITTPQLHVILYLANTLAGLFGVTRVRGRVLKRGAYPFFPDVQREVDQLAFCGVLQIENVDFGSKGHMSAQYKIGPQGKSISQALTSHLPEAMRTANLMRELVCACFGRFLVDSSDIGKVDANYGDSNILEGEVVDFSEWRDENKNMEVASHLIDRLRSLRPNARRDGVRMYCDYLDRAMALA